MVTTKAQVKSRQDGIIEGYAALWGGTDLDGERFEKTTDFMEGFTNPNPPVLFDHSYDSAVKGSVLGKVLKFHKDNVGLWFEAQLDRAQKYADAIMDLIEAGALGLSTGSTPQLTMREGKSIKRWPIAELSLTPTPADPRTIQFVTVKSAIKELGIDLPMASPEGVTIPVNITVSVDPVAATAAVVEALEEEEEITPAEEAPTASQLDLIATQLQVTQLLVDDLNEELINADASGTA